MKKRKITMLFLIAGLLFSGCGKSDASDATDISSVKLKSNQKIVIGKITEIAGNEMTYTILKKASAKSSSSDQSKNSNSGNAPDQNGNGNDSSNAGNTPDQSSSSNDSSNSGNASDQGSNDNDSSNGSGGMPAMQTEAAVRDRCRQEDRAMHQETHRMPMACKISKIAIPIAAQDRTAAKANPLRKANRTQTAKRRA